MLVKVSSPFRDLVHLEKSQLALQYWGDKGTQGTHMAPAEALRPLWHQKGSRQRSPQEPDIYSSQSILQFAKPDGESSPPLLINIHWLPTAAYTAHSEAWIRV